MNQPQIFSATLGLFAPWRIARIAFSDHEKRVDITVDTPSGELLPCPACGAAGTAGNDRAETWQHRNFFSHTAYIHIRIPSIACPLCGGRHSLTVPWTAAETNFVLLDQTPA